MLVLALHTNILHKKLTFFCFFPKRPLKNLKMRIFGEKKTEIKTNISLFPADIHTYKLTFVSFFLFFFCTFPLATGMNLRQWWWYDAGVRRQPARRPVQNSSCVSGSASQGACLTGSSIRAMMTMMEVLVMMVYKVVPSFEGDNGHWNEEWNLYVKKTFISSPKWH